MVGRRAPEAADVLVTVGELGQIIGKEALASGMPGDAVHLVDDNPSAIALLRKLIGAGDILLVKGSRGMAMEEIVAALAVNTPESPGEGQEQGRS